MLVMSLRIAIFTAAILYCSAANGRVFSWPRAPEDIVADVATHRVASDPWQSAEISAILEKAAKLEAYHDMRKPDCFRRVAGALRVHCGQLELDEEERIRAAIAMTLCELATANHSPPLECTPLSVDGQSSGTSSKPSLNTCVEALSRSAQYWASYSGYLREVPQLCYAFRRWHDIDTAKEAYRNATLEVTSLLQIVKMQADDSLSRQARADEMLQRAQAVLTNTDVAQTEMTQLSVALHDFVSGISAEAMTIFRDTLVSWQEAHVVAGQHAAEEMSVTLDLLVGKHATALGALVPSLGRGLEAQFSAVISGVAIQYQVLQQHAQSAMIQWQSFSGDIQELQQSIERLLATTSEAASQLAAHTSQAAISKRVQQDATDSAARLALALAELTNGTRDELSTINATAAAVKEELSSARRYHASTWDAPRIREWVNFGLMWFIQTVFGGSQPNLDILLQLPTVRIACFCLQALWYLLRISLSTVASSLFLVFSLRRWLSTITLLRTKSAGDEEQPRSSLHAKGPLFNPATAPEYSHSASLTFDPPPARSAYLAAARAASGPAARGQPTRFSRIPDRLCNPRRENCGL